MIKKDLVLVCNKCEHYLFITGGVSLTGKEIYNKLKKMEGCPECGEEWEENFSISRLGNYEKEFNDIE